MELRFYKDAAYLRSRCDGGWVRQVLRRPGEKRRGSGKSWIALGQTEVGRYLRVIYVPDPGTGSAFVITAFNLTGNALKAHRRYLKRRRR